MNNKAKPSVLVKLSGEALSNGGEKYSDEVLEKISLQIRSLQERNVRIALVVGGGNLFRGAELQNEQSSLTRPTADYIGMLATLQNALVLRDYFESRGISTRVLSSITVSQLCEPYIPQKGRRHMEKGRVVIFAAGLGVPFFSTDTTAVQRALEIGSDFLVLSKNGVDGLYDADPNENAEAKKIETTTCSEVLEKDLKVADGAAVALARDNNLRMKIVSVSDIQNIYDDTVGSAVLPE